MVTDRSDDRARTIPPPDKDETAESALVPQLAMMSRGLWVSQTRNTVALLAGALLVLNVAQRSLGEMLKLKLRQGVRGEFVNRKSSRNKPLEQS